MNPPYRSHRNHNRLSTSLPNPAIDTKISEHSPISTPETPLPNRLTRLAHRTGERVWISHDDSIIIHHCLDTIEGLVDPRATFTKEITRSRPKRPELGGVGLVATNSAVANHCPRRDDAEMGSRMAELLDEVTALKRELDMRREESARIHALFEDRCRGLERMVGEGEVEIDGLQADIFDDTIEMEGLQGTVHGLERWVGDWQRQHDLDLARELSDRSSKQGRRAARRSGYQNDNEERLLEGIMAWIRGWKDVEEGFRTRENERRLRREAREHQQMSVDYERPALPQLWEHRSP